MLLRRHREVPDVDPEFDLTPAETLDQAFRPGEAHEVEALKGDALDEALREHGLSTAGKADEKRERLSAYLSGADLI